MVHTGKRRNGHRARTGDSIVAPARSAMETEHLFDFEELEGPEEQKRSGPPNRMNDLRYSDWMKFQKSFFRFQGWEALLDETVRFFTKEVWPDGQPSRTLLLGINQSFDASSLGRRIIVSHVSDSLTIDTACAELSALVSAGQTFDFALVNLTKLSADSLRKNHSSVDALFRSLRTLVTASRYCCVVADWPVKSSFPLPWAVALLGRKHLKLRDERIGLLEGENSTRYCLVFQSEEDEGAASEWLPDDIGLCFDEKASFPAWIFPKSPPRKADEVFHPAKFPESLITAFIRAFTNPSDTVLDPMVGTGSALVAASREGRNGIGIELNPSFAEIAKNRVQAENPSLLLAPTHTDIHTGDARNVSTLVERSSVQYCVTSPPYWSMLSNAGSENQKARREKNLPMVYSDNELDVGNISSYQEFLALLIQIYEAVADVLSPDGHLSVIVKNVKREHVIYPLAWDLVRKLARKGGKFTFCGATLWCQDDVPLKPFAVGIYWVSNTLHTYCLHFRRC